MNRLDMFSPVKLLLLLSSHALAAPFIEPCPLPTWNITNFRVTYGLEVRSQAPVTFNITNNVTGESSALSCSLRANSICEVRGTPSDQSLHITIQTSINMLFVTIEDNVSCANVYVMKDPPWFSFSEQSR